MKVLFLTFTPYHVKLSNYLARKYYNDMSNYIITIDINHTKNEVLDEFIDKSVFKEISKFNFNFRVRNLITNYKAIKSESRAELAKYISSVKEFNPDLVVFFSDNPVEYQILFNSITCDKMLVEEGIGIYIESIHKKRYIKIKDYIYHKVHMHIYNDKVSRYFLHGQGGYENIICAREPHLTKSKAKRMISIDKQDFREIFKYRENINMDINKGILFCPVQMKDYSKKQIRDMIQEICNYYYEEKIYIKLHPAEKKVKLVKDSIKQFGKRVEIIENSKVTSEDLILNGNIKCIISDYSSTLVNAVYLRDDIDIVSCLGLLQKKYNLKICFKSTIFRKLIECGDIKSFKGYEISA